MAKTNHGRVGEALELLAQGLAPFVEQEVRPSYGDDWVQTLAKQMSGKDRPAASATDCQFLLKVMWDQWNTIFTKTLGSNERSLVRILQNHRNAWAHQEKFTTIEAARAIDNVLQMLQAISAPQSVEAEKHWNEITRLKLDEQSRHERRKIDASYEGTEVSGLPAWRDIIAPHPDVASGSYQQAEFAADLSQVYRGEAASEYQDPAEFYRRTFLTEGLSELLVQAVQRLSKSGGVPIVDLQTNFGGGKTHSLLALYHLASGRKSSELPGMEGILTTAKVKELPSKVTPAVLVGTAISPGQFTKKKDGCRIHTLWGELAWQLGGKKSYELLRHVDEKGVAPGSDLLVELFKSHAPCLILIDEWVAYARQLYGKEELPAGTFDSHFTFAQALCEAARAVPGTLLVISIPASEPSRNSKGTDGVTDIEIGGVGGRAALERLRNVIGRMESPWRPASAEESFEIVRRRLFEPMDSSTKAKRDAVARKFFEFYQTNMGDFPSDVRDTGYERRIRDAYPIHPELFDRLYEDWSSLERFQRTRGVLRLMAGVIHVLWEQGDKSPLVMPGNIPIHDRNIAFELTRYLEDHWVPVIESDIDGPNALPLKVDRENPNLGRAAACRRVARTIYMGSAPTLRTGNQGIDDRSIRLGCVVPGESPAIFGDALRRLGDQATHLYTDGGRYWFSTQTNVTRTAKDKAAHYRIEAVHDEVIRRIRADKKRADFAGVHACPNDTADIPDEPEARLVILDPEFTYSSRTKESNALSRAAEILQNRGSIPRQYRNMLVFLVADTSNLEDLLTAARDFLAWKEIDDQKEELNLDAHQRKQAETKRAQADDAVDRRIKETWQWLLIPTQELQGDLDWNKVKVSGDDPLAQRATKKLKSEEELIVELAPSVLRLHLDRTPLWQGNHVGLKRAWECFSQYLYLPRLRDVDVFLGAVQDGTNMITWDKDGFAYAESYDEGKDRYVGLRVGRGSSVTMTSDSVIVKSEVAKTQLDTEKRDIEGEGRGGKDDGEEDTGGKTGGDKGGGTGDGTDDKKPAGVRRFHAIKRLDAQRMSTEAGNIAQNIVTHLAKHLDADVEIVIEINAKFKSDVPDADVRTVTENCATLKVDGGFERE